MPPGRFVSLWLSGLVVIGFAVAGASAIEGVVPIATAQRGLVFSNGAFVPGPHPLERAETAEAIEIRVSGIRLDRIPLGPPAGLQAASAPSALAPYEIPPGIDGLQGSGYPLWLHRRLTQDAGRIGLQAALDRAEADARRSPLVRRVEREDDGLLLVDRYGDPYFVEAGQPAVPPPLSRAAALALADRTLEVYRALLDDGGAILHFDDKDVFLPRRRVEDVLLPSLATLTDTSLSEEGKRERLTARWGDRALVRQLMQGFRSGPQLHSAIEPYRTGGSR